jgi:hypothetical protein
VTIEERGGELVITGGTERPAFSTDQCWQMHPGLSAQSHTASAGIWKTSCRTAPNDARQELLQTTLSLAGDVLSLQESGQYQFVVQGQTCAASSGRWRTYRRVAAAPAPVEAPVPVQAPPAARPPASNPCASPGAAARLEVKPSRKLMRAGDSFHFRAIVSDAQGCSLGAAVTWSVSPEDAGATIDNGRLTIAAGAADGSLRVTASVGSQSVRVNVDVVSDDRYAALLASGAFNAEGASSESVSATITAGSLGARAPGPSAAGADRKWTFVGLVSAIALLFAFIGAWLLRRGRRAARRSVALGRTLPDSGTALFTGDEFGGLALPAEGRRGPRRLEATRLEGAETASANKPATVCPVCGTLYDTRSVRVCPKDGAQLLPVNA